MTDVTARPRVAIIMRSKDEQPHVRSTLEMLGRQTYPHHVLYSVDSGSTDGTVEVIRRHNRAAERIVQIPPGAYVPGKVLNDMIARTSEPVVVLLNADAIPRDERWLELLLEPIVTGAADATMSRQVARPGARFVVHYDYDRAYGDRFDGRRIDSFSAVACAFRRELWDATRFREQGYAEDTAWARTCRDRGARFVYVPRSVVEHSHDFTLSGLYRKRFRHGQAFVQFDGERPAIARAVYRWFCETVRDTLHALAMWRLDTIPYNLAYRAVIHVADHRGRIEGLRLVGSRIAEETLMLPDHCNASSVGRLRYIQSVHESGERRNPDTLVRHFIPLLQKLRIACLGSVTLARLRADPFYYYLVARTRFYDGVVRDAIAGGVRRIVNIGCGTDTRPYRFHRLLEGHGVRNLECDQPRIIAAKRRLFERLGRFDHVEYLPLELNDPSCPALERRLIQKPSLPTLVMMEGVSPYVDQDSIGRVLWLLGRTLVPGSRVAFDYKLRGVDDDFGRSARTCRPFRLGERPDEVARYARQFGLELERLELGAALSVRLLPALGSAAPRFCEDAVVELRVGGAVT